MPRKQKKYHYLYKTTNVVNSKYYVGMHSTDNLEDGYIGSGKILWYSIKKYGRENFKIEILEFFENRNDLIQREKDVVNEDFLRDPLCMNLQMGGSSGFDYIREKRIKDTEYDKWFKKLQGEKFKKAHKEGKIKPFDWTGKNHTEETKKILSEQAKLKIGDKNSQYGTCWIFNDEKKESKKIKSVDLQKWIDEGWNRGRKLKFN